MASGLVFFLGFLSLQIEGQVFEPSLRFFSCCLFLSNSNVLVFVLSYFIVSYYYLLEASLSSTERQKGVNLGGRAVGRIGKSRGRRN